MSNKNKNKTNGKQKLLALTLALGSFGLQGQGQELLGQWNFDDGFDSDDEFLIKGVFDNGDELEIATDEFQEAAVIDTVDNLGINTDAFGSGASALCVPKLEDEAEGVFLSVDLLADNGGILDNWTIIMDVYFPADTAGTRRGLLDIIGGDDYAGAEFYVGADDGIAAFGISGGVARPETWARLAWSIDTDRDSPGIDMFIDGSLVATFPLNDSLVLGQVASLTNDAMLFADSANAVEQTYVSDIQIWDSALGAGQIFALGGASSEGLPQDLPTVPSFPESWMPNSVYANATTEVGVVINSGGAAVDQDSIVFSLDGAEISDLSIEDDGELIIVSAGEQTFGVSTDHVMELTYTDDKDGSRTFTREFRVPVLFEDFEGLVLEDAVDEGTDEEIWTKTPPEGWNLDDTGVPGFDSEDEDGDGFPDLDGVTEWAGWSFADKEWWVGVAGGQRRGEYILGEGNVAIADPDEWDDTTHAASGQLVDGGGAMSYNTFLISPTIDLSGLAPDSLFMTFDSSWRPEDTQTATVTVSYDGGEKIELLLWESPAASPNYKDDNSTNESILLLMNNPAGASEAVVEFGLTEAGNDWWWAVDNIVIDAGAAPPTIVAQPENADESEGDPASFTVEYVGGEPVQIQWYKGVGASREAIEGATSATLEFPSVSGADAGFYSVEITNEAGSITSNVVELKVLLAIPVVRLSENFDDLELGPNVDEGTTDATAFTKDGPDGWTREDDVPGIGDPEVGVEEWEGWSFADPTFWATVGGQSRDAFSKGAGVIAVADGDEWDDLGSPSGAGLMNTFITTPEIDLSGLLPESGVIRFDSSWRPDPDQIGTLEAEFDTGDTLELIRWESDSASPNFKSDDQANWNETITIPFTIPDGASSVTLTFGYTNAGNDWWWAIDNLVVGGAIPPLFSEDFESVELQDSTSPTEINEANAWSANPPSGWSLDNSGTVPGGVPEFDGWTFANADWWMRTAEDQRRTEFVNATGTIMIADPDEWDDADPGPSGLMNAFASTPAIALGDAPENAVVLEFDSSWRPEDTQTAVISVAYDGGESMEVLRWESNSESANFKDNAPNERVDVRLNNPAGASEAVITFGMIDAGNDWWWGIDNIEVKVSEVVTIDPPIIASQPVGGAALQGNRFVLSVDASGVDAFQWYIVDANGDRTAIEGATGASYEPTESGDYEVDAINAGGATTSSRVSVEFEIPLVGNILYFEGFENIELGSNVDETVAGDAVWSATPPEGWTVDNLDTPAGGVTEWSGWGFANAAWWASVDDQNRSAFTKAVGTAAIGDGDEWDDLPHDDGEISTIMTSGAIDIAGIDAGSAYLRFDSSWRPFDTQTGVITASYDGGEPMEILRWESDGSSEFFKSDDQGHWNETVILPLHNPEGASELTLSFGYLTAGNDWWWAIDNITVGSHPFFEGFDNLAFGPNVDEELAGDEVWTDVGPDNWLQDNSGVPGFGTDLDGVTEWAGWNFATFDWWSEAAGNQRRAEFTNAMGGVAVADGDEWDDADHPAKGNLPENGGSESFDAFLSTPAISLADFAENEAILEFDSSWRPEDSQTATITASFDGGEAIEILRWESNDDNGFFHGDEVNETVRIPLNNAADASEVVLTFGYTLAGNDWWWAIDNVKVSKFESGDVTPGAEVEIALEGGSLTISFTGSVLESAPSVTGPWTPVAGASSPYTQSTDAVDGAIYFRSVE